LLIIRIIENSGTNQFLTGTLLYKGTAKQSYLPSKIFGSSLDGDALIILIETFTLLHQFQLLLKNKNEELKMI